MLLFKVINLFYLLCVLSLSSGDDSTNVLFYVLMHWSISYILIIYRDTLKIKNNRVNFSRTFFAVNWLYYTLAITSYYGNHGTFAYYGNTNLERFISNMVVGFILLVYSHLISVNKIDFTLILRAENSNKIFHLCTVVIFAAVLYLYSNGIGSAYNATASLNINNATPLQLLLIMVLIYISSVFSLFVGLNNFSGNMVIRFIYYFILGGLLLFIVFALSSRLLIFSMIILYLIGRSVRTGVNYWVPCLLITPIFLVLTGGLVLKILGREFESGFQFIFDEISYRVTLVDYALALEKAYSFESAVNLLTDAFFNILPRIFFEDKPVGYLSMTDLHSYANLPDLDYPDTIFSFASMMMGFPFSIIVIILIILISLFIDKLFVKFSILHCIIPLLLVFSLKIEIGPFEFFIFVRDFMFLAMIFLITKIFTIKFR